MNERPPYGPAAAAGTVRPLGESARSAAADSTAATATRPATKDDDDDAPQSGIDSRSGQPQLRPETQRPVAAAEADGR